MSVRRVSRRELLKLSMGGALGLVSASVAGCQQAPGLLVTTPQPAAPATVATARRLRYAAPFELETYDPKDTTEWQGGIFDVYETLTHSNAETGELEGRLAESWEQVEPTVWRFRLRQGIQFTNGEPFNSEAVRVAVERVTGPEAINRSYMGELQEARTVDEYTIDLITAQPDPILPKRAVFLFIGAPEWLSSAAPEEIAVSAVGTGPLRLAEWQRGQHILLQENEDYWGPNRARVPEVQIVFRQEASVRADMVIGGEADLGFSISYADAERVPRTARASNVRVQGIRINTRHPVLQDIRVRQAMVHAVDTATIAETIYQGFVAPANGQLVNSSATGWNPDLEPYPYDPDTARQLLEEAEAVGTALTLNGITGGFFQRDLEQLEAITEMLGEVGLNVELRVLDQNRMVEYLVAGQEGAPQSDLHHVQHGNDLMDSELTFSSYYACDGALSQFCDPRMDELIEAGRPLSGEAREEAFREAWAYAYTQYPWIPTINVEWLYAVGQNVDWIPRRDGIMYFSEIGFME